MPRNKNRQPAAIPAPKETSLTHLNDLEVLIRTRQDLASAQQKYHMEWAGLFFFFGSPIIGSMARLAIKKFMETNFATSFLIDVPLATLAQAAIFFMMPTVPNLPQSLSECMYEFEYYDKENIRKEIAHLEKEKAHLKKKSWGFANNPTILLAPAVITCFFYLTMVENFIAHDKLDAYQEDYKELGQSIIMVFSRYVFFCFFTRMNLQHLGSINNKSYNNLDAVLAWLSKHIDGYTVERDAQKRSILIKFNSNKISILSELNEMTALKLPAKKAIKEILYIFETIGIVAYPDKNIRNSIKMFGFSKDCALKDHSNDLDILEQRLIYLAQIEQYRCDGMLDEILRIFHLKTDSAWHWSLINSMRNELLTSFYTLIESSTPKLIDLFDQMPKAGVHLQYAEQEMIITVGNMADFSKYIFENMPAPKESFAVAKITPCPSRSTIVSRPVEQRSSAAEKSIKSSSRATKTYQHDASDVNPKKVTVKNAPPQNSNIIPKVKISQIRNNQNFNLFFSVDLTGLERKITNTTTVKRIKQVIEKGRLLSSASCGDPGMKIYRRNGEMFFAVKAKGNSAAHIRPVCQKIGEDNNPDGSQTWHFKYIYKENK